MDERVIGDRYELRRPIGSGGMARVYLASDRLLERDVAVKVLHHEAAADPAFVERFRREARAAASLNHPNIVAIYDWGSIDDTYYMVMEYVPGPNLKEVLRDHGPLPEVQALDIAAQTAAALQVAHDHNIIHRDVKPHNVLIDPHGWVKVTDFGIARAAGLSQLTRTNIVSGTAHYLSPEQAQRQELDGRSDIYSLGVVLFEILAGREPFTGDSLVEVALQHVHAPPPPLREIRPDISAATEAVVMKALAKAPANRFQSAGEMRDALNAVRSKLLDASVKKVEETAPARLVAANLPDPETPMERTEVVPRAAVVRQAAPASSPPASSPWNANRWLLAVPLALLILLLIGGSLLAHPSFLFGSGGKSPSPRHHVASVPRPTSTPTSRPTPVRRRPAAAAPTPVPTTRPTSAPVVVPPPSIPTPTPVPPTAVPTSPPASSAPPTAVVASSGSGASGPESAVQSFYADVNSGAYGQAAALWTPRMQSQWQPYDSINKRFEGRRIVVRNTSLISRGNGRAAVAASLQQINRDGSTQDINITWYLVRTDNGWMLDDESSD